MCIRSLGHEGVASLGETVDCRRKTACLSQNINGRPVGHQPEREFNIQDVTPYLHFVDALATLGHTCSPTCDPNRWSSFATVILRGDVRSAGRGSALPPARVSLRLILSRALHPLASCSRRDPADCSVPSTGNPDMLRQPGDIPHCVRANHRRAVSKLPNIDWPAEKENVFSQRQASNKEKKPADTAVGGGGEGVCGLFKEGIEKSWSRRTDITIRRRAAVAERLDYSPPTKANRVQSPAGHSRFFACENRAGRCRWSAGFLGDLPFPPPFHSSAAPYSPQSPSSALKTSLLSAVQNSSLTHSHKWH
ncbi:hypothetical protein PR048_002899 [Dryococelus australis]|uniref:Uncharacterized protein n=1 Tax=Dryococelus australis TaxID=614101 RepID=A0ABQ9IN01_9NEOP|nr:hypothetical protein PR048_002899 [Dryococelus australis]